jgi:hypothetical protein
MGVVLGLHSPVQGATDRFHDTLAALRAGPTVVVWTDACGPQDTDPDVTNLVRLDTPMPEEPPTVYVNRVAPIVGKWFRSGVPATFIPGNEPTVQAGDVIRPWTVDGWKLGAAAYATVLRSIYPGIRLGSVPMEVEETQYLDDAYFALWDAVTVHCYWQIEEDIDNPNLGGAWRYAPRDGRPVYVTEVNVAPPDDHAPGRSYTDPAQIAEWLLTLDGRVTGVCLYIADGADTEDWREYDVSPQQAATIRHAYDHFVQPPTPEEPSMDYTRDTEPLHTGKAFARDAWLAHIRAVNPAQADEIVATYAEDAPVAIPDYDINLAIAQACVECTDFTSRRWRASFASAGVGIYSDGTPDVQWGGVRDGIRAQLELLSDYFGDGRKPWGVLAAHGFGFAAPLGKVRLSEMDGVWAADRNYSLAIANMANVVVGGAAPVPHPAPAPAGVTLEAIYHQAEIRVGMATTDEGNPEFMWCEQEREEQEQAAGLPRVRYGSAAERGVALEAAGKFRRGIPPRGAGVVWDLTFEPRGGHIATASDYPFIITTHSSGRIVRLDARANGWYDSPGYLGYYVPDGVAEGEESDDMPRYGHKMDPGLAERIWEYANKGKAKKNRIERVDERGNKTGIYLAFERDQIDGSGPFGSPWGLPLGKEYSFKDGSNRTCQDFTNGVATAVPLPDGTWQVTFN